MAEAFDKLAVLRQLIAERDRLNRAIAALMESDPAAGTGHWPDDFQCALSRIRSAG